MIKNEKFSFPKKAIRRPQALNSKIRFKEYLFLGKKMMKEKGLEFQVNSRPLVDFDRNIRG